MTARPQPATGMAPRLMWFLALVLGVGILSLATAALPGRAKPLFLLPLAFGLASAGLSLALRRSLSIASSLPIWGITTALALGGYGQVVMASFQKFQSQAGAAQAADDKTAIAIEMLKGTEHNDVAEKMEKDRANRHDGWDDYLSRRYASLGRVAPPHATWALAVEALMVIAGVAAGRRLLDGKPSTCQAADPAAEKGGGTNSS